MSEIQHKSLRDEILYVLGRSTIALNGSEIYERCTLADEMKQVSNAVFQLKAASKIVAAEGEGRPRYKLADGVSTPAPAGKAGRPPIADPDAAPATATRPTVEIPTLGAPVSPVGKNPGPKPKAKPAEPDLPVIDIPPPEEPKTEREKGKVEAAFRQARKSTAREFAPSDASLADAIIARLKTDLGPMLRPYISESIEAETGAVGPSVHIHIEQVDIHLGGL